MITRALQFVLLLAAAATLCHAQERRSWNKIRYVGGTVPIKVSPYDWNVRLTVATNPNTVTIEIAPASVFGKQQTLRLDPSRITAVTSGPGTWQRVADVPGAQLPPKPSTLFGLIADRALFAILYQGSDGKPGALLLDSYFAGQIGSVLEGLTGKPVEFAK